jgi:pyrroloquinoline quinone (PQQ) biosynthesis protein C
MVSTNTSISLAEAFKSTLVPYEKAIVDGRLFTEMANGTLSAEKFRYALKYFFPLVESFPKLMGLCLAKTSATSAGAEASGWLIHNIQIERRHANWFKDWAIGFGVAEQDFIDGISPPPTIDALNHYLWRTCTYGDLIEAVSSLNYAIEGPTGIWTKRVMQNIHKYHGKNGISVNINSVRWLRAHAHYDDHHPDEALGVTLMHVTSEQDLARAIKAAQDSMAYYAMAADACYDLIN